MRWRGTGLIDVMVWYRFDRRDGVTSSWLTRWRGAELPDTMTLYRIARRNDMVPGCSMRLILNATLFVINLFVVNEMRTTCCVCVQCDCLRVRCHRCWVFGYHVIYY